MRIRSRYAQGWREGREQGKREGRIAGLRAAARKLRKAAICGEMFDVARWCEREARKLEKEARRA